MPKITKNTPTVNATVAGQIVKMPMPYAEGHTCNANEAAALNQTFRENVSNNVRKKVEEAAANGADEGTIQKIVSDFASTYEFSASGGGGRTTDPVMKEALDIARNKIKEKLVANGVAASSIDSKELTRLAHEAVERHPQLLEAAKAIVESRKATTQSVLGGLDLS